MNIERWDKGSVILLQTSKNTLAKVNFYLIRLMVEKTDDRVMFFSVEKPHHYMTHLLGLNGVPQRTITYVDIVSPGAADISFPARVGEGRGLVISGFVTRDIILLEDYRFLIVDNIEFLTHMWSEGTLEKFIRSIIREGKKSKTTVIFPVKKVDKIAKILGELVDAVENVDEVMK